MIQFDGVVVMRPGRTSKLDKMCGVRVRVRNTGRSVTSRKYLKEKLIVCSFACVLI